MKLSDIIAEGYKLQLERDGDLYVLNIYDTETKHRTEVRGKSGYEIGNYDPNDPLHRLLDTIGKTANVSELINGEIVTVNPNHPTAELAKRAIHRAFTEEFKHADQARGGGPKPKAKKGRTRHPLHGKLVG